MNIDTMDTIYVHHNDEKKCERKKKTMDGLKFIEGPHRMTISYEKAAKSNKMKYLPLYQSGDQNTGSYSLKLNKIGRFFNARNIKPKSNSKTSIPQIEKVANQKPMTYFKYKHSSFVPNYRYKCDLFEKPSLTIKRRSTAMQIGSNVISRNLSICTSKTYRVSAAKIRKRFKSVYSKSFQSKGSIPSVNTAMLSESTLYKSSSKQATRNVDLSKFNSKLGSNMCDDNVISLFKTEALTSNHRMKSVSSFHEMKLNKLVAFRTQRGRKKRRRRIQHNQDKSPKILSKSPKVRVVEVEDVYNGTIVNNKEDPPEIMSLRSPVQLISSSDFDIRFYEDGITKNIHTCKDSSKPKMNENILMKQSNINRKNTIMSVSAENVTSKRLSDNLWDCDSFLRKTHSAHKLLNFCYLVKQYISRPHDQSMLPSEIIKMAKIVILLWLLKRKITMNKKRVPKIKDNNNITFVTKHFKEFTPDKCVSGVCINEQGEISRCLLLITHRNNYNLNGDRIYNVNDNKKSISSSITEKTKFWKRNTDKKQCSQRQVKLKIPPRHSRALENINVSSYQPVAFNFELNFTNDVYNDKLNISGNKTVPSKNIFTCTPVKELCYKLPRCIVKNNSRKILQQNNISIKSNTINKRLAWKSVPAKFNSREYQVWALRRNRLYDYQPQVKKKTGCMSRLTESSDKKPHEKTASSKNKNVECTHNVLVDRYCTTTTNNSQVEKSNVDTEDLELHRQLAKVKNSSVDKYELNSHVVNYDNVINRSLNRSKIDDENTKCIFFTPNLDSKYLNSLNKHKKGPQNLVKSNALTLTKAEPDNFKSTLPNTIYDEKKCDAEKTSASINNMRSIYELLRRIDYKLSKPFFLHHTSKVFDFFKHKIQSNTKYRK